jgi:hypothetical protein
MSDREALCWSCCKAYQIESDQCPHCCATNANVDLDSANIESQDKSRIDHEWEFQDDSFDHEFGTERVHYWQCQRCGAMRDMEPADYHPEYDDPTP